MVLRYFGARLKRGIGQTAAGSIALCFIAVILILSCAMPGILDTAMINHSRRFAGSADLTLTLAADSGDRFFGLTLLREDTVLKENAEYINGYFKAFVQVGPPGAQEKDFCTLFAADYEKQNEYNPVKAAALPDYLTADEIIIGSGYAAERGLKINDKLTVSLGGRTASFDIICIAESQGLFSAGSAVFISSQALRRLNSLGSEIVTHCFIKAKDPASLNIITERLNTEYKRLAAAYVTDTNQMTEIKTNITVPVLCVTGIAAVFCLLALVILLRLVFARDRENYRTFRMLGMRERAINAVNILTGLLMCVFAFAGAYFIINAALSLLRGMSLLFADAAIGAPAYITGLAGTFAAGMACAVIGGLSFNKKDGRKVRKPGAAALEERAEAPRALPRPPEPRRFIRLDTSGLNLLIFGISAVLGALAVLITETLPYIGFAAAVTAIAGLIFSLPKAAAFICGKIHGARPDIYTLRLKTLAARASWRRFAAFAAVGSLVVITVIFTSANLHNGIRQKSDYPFDVIVCEITRPDETVFQKVSAAEGVAGAVKCGFYPDIKFTSGDASFRGSLFGLDEEGFSYFGADFTAVREYGGAGAVIGHNFARRNSLNPGDTFSFAYGKQTVVLTAVETLKSNYLDGDFVLAGLAKVSSQARPYSEIMVKSGADAARTVNNINASSGGGLSALEIKALSRLYMDWYSDFVWLSDAFTVSIAALVALTAAFIILLRLDFTREEFKKLAPLGLTRAANVRHNLVSVFFALLPLLLFLPFLMSLLYKAAFAVYYFFGLSRLFPYDFLTVSGAAAACFLFIIMFESIMCFWASSGKKG